MYTLISSFAAGESGKIFSYGILWQGNPPVQILDISSERETVQALVDLLNDFEVDVVHFADLVTDFLADPNAYLFS